MNSKTEKLVTVLRVLTWIAFVGLLIKTGTILFNYILSFKNEAVAQNLFGGIDLYEYLTHDFMQYSFLVVYKIFLFALEAYIAFLVIKLLNTLNLKQPFNQTLHTLMRRISYSILYLWIIAMIHNTHMQFIGLKYNFKMDLFSSDFIFLAAIIFIFAQIVKRGIEIQTENDLTI